MSWSLSPGTYHCREHPTVELTREVFAQLGDGGISIPGGNFSYLRNRRFLFRSTSGSLRIPRPPKKGPFTIAVACPGVPGTPTKDEDKPHQEICRGEVVR